MSYNPEAQTEDIGHDVSGRHNFDDNSQCRVHTAGDPFFTGKVIRLSLQLIPCDPIHETIEDIPACHIQKTCTHTFLKHGL